MTYVYNQGQPRPTGGGDKGGGSPTSNPSVNISLIPYVGGLSGASGIMAIPFIDLNSGQSYIAIYDPNNFDTEEDCEYQYRVEEIDEGKKPTVNRIRFRYRDIGKCKVTFRVTGQSGLFKEEEKTFGGKNDGRIYTEFVTLIITDYDPQLSIIRKANAGPMAILSAAMCIADGDGPQL